MLRSVEKMKKLNLFFFGEEYISLSDFLWFYGLNGFAVLVFIITKWSVM
jgi:hypothetical protein